MIDKTLSYLDFTKLLYILKKYALTPFSKEAVLNVRPLNSLEEINERQKRIEEISEVVRWEGKFPISDLPDVRSIIRRVFIKDAILEAKELLALAQFLARCEDLANFLKRAYSKGQYIEDILHRLNPLGPLRRHIAKTINIEGFVEDTGSYELSRIRADLYTVRDRTRKRLERIMEKEAVRPILQDTYISVRNGRYVIPLKPNFNEVVQGIVHDYSHSLKTSFVEPIEIVELNNAVNILVKDEKEEERRILRELTDFVRRHGKDIETDLDVIKEVDFFHLLALFALEFNCVRPLLRESGLLNIKGARNPFIALSRKSDTVPIDIFMDADTKAMIISGPNAGGKTAALKTIGLLCLMAQSGLFIPAQGSPEVPMFSNVFAIIGDEQDISMELSSFTAHMYTVKDLYGMTRGGELILIDEIGGNTEPQEASALSMAIMDAFVEKGCRVIVTTHLNLIKAYGFTKPFAINVATAFDSTAMQPLYRLVYGTAGYSNAISVAKNIHVPKEIVERSYEYLGKQEYMLNDLITALEQGKRKVEEEYQRLRSAREEMKNRLSLVKTTREDYLRKVEEKCDARLRELEKELQEVSKDLAKKEKASLAKGRERLRRAREQFVRNVAIAQDLPITKGDYVKVRSLGAVGHVVAVGKDHKIFEVAIGNVRTKVEAGLLERIPRKQESRQDAGIQVQAEGVSSLEINVIGLRVEEALKEVDRFLDRALLQGISKVKIVHGIGRGRLMTAIRDHCSRIAYVGDSRKDDSNPGVTIVDLS